MSIWRIECRQERNDLKKILGQYDSLGLYCPNGFGLKNDCKLRKLRATLGLSVHSTTVSYTKLFLAAAANIPPPGTPNHEFTVQ